VSECLSPYISETLWTPSQKPVKGISPNFGHRCIDWLVFYVKWFPLRDKSDLEIQADAAAGKQLDAMMHTGVLINGQLNDIVATCAGESSVGSDDDVNEQ